MAGASPPPPPRGPLTIRNKTAHGEWAAAQLDKLAAGDAANLARALRSPSPVCGLPPRATRAATAAAAAATSSSSAAAAASSSAAASAAGKTSAFVGLTLDDLSRVFPPATAAPTPAPGASSSAPTAPAAAPPSPTAAAFATNGKQYKGQVVFRKNWPELVYKYDLVRDDVVELKLQAFGVKLTIYKADNSSARQYICPDHG